MRECALGLRLASGLVPFGCLHCWPPACLELLPAVLTIYRLRRLQSNVNSAQTISVQWEQRYQEQRQAAADSESQHQQSEQAMSARISHLEQRNQHLQHIRPSDCVYQRRRRGVALHSVAYGPFGIAKSISVESPPVYSPPLLYAHQSEQGILSLAPPKIDTFRSFPIGSSRTGRSVQVALGGAPGHYYTASLNWNVSGKT